MTTAQRTIEYQERVIAALLTFTREAMDAAQDDLRGWPHRVGSGVRDARSTLFQTLERLGITPSVPVSCTDEYACDTSYKDLCQRDVRRGLNTVLHNGITLDPPVKND